MVIGTASLARLCESVRALPNRSLGGSSPLFRGSPAELPSRWTKR